MAVSWPKPPHFHLNFVDTLAFYAASMSAAGKESPDALKAVKKRLGETDLFFLAVFILKREDICREWLFKRCREFQADPDDHLDLWAREHYKSTVITFTGTIFEFIQDVEVTACIFSHTKAIARDFLNQIKMEMEMNRDLPDLWPDVFWQDPAKQAPSWSIDGGLTLNRKQNPKEKSLEAHGLVDGQPTGRHFKLRIYDDVVTLESVNTTEQILKTTYAFRMSDNLGAEGGRIRGIGTRYHLFDTYRTIMDDQILKPRVHPATHNGKEYGTPVLLSAETLATKRRNQGPYVFSCQMLLNPVADASMGFKLEWLRHEDIPHPLAMSKLWRFILVDPAGSKGRKNNDYTTMWVLGHGADGQYRVLEIVRDRLNLSGRARKLIDLHKKWKPGAVGYEEYGMQGDIEYIQLVQKSELYEFVITPLGGQMPKPLRIQRIVPHFENGFKSVEAGGDGIAKSRIILPTRQDYIDYQGHSHDLVKDFVEQEYTAFPVLDHDDMLDCLSRIADLEEMRLIETPKDTSDYLIESKIQKALNKTQNQGQGSWQTV